MTNAASTIKVQVAVDNIMAAFGDTAGTQITSGNIIAWINEAQIAIVSRNKITKKTDVTALTVPGTQKYPMPLDIIQIESVQIGNNFPSNMGFEEAKGRFSTYVSDRGAPLFWSMWGNDIYLYPTPDSAQTITVYYTARPQDVSSLNDFLSLPDRYYSAILDFCKMKAYELDEASDWHQIKDGQFERGMTNLANAENESMGAFPTLSDREYEDYGW